MNYKISITGIPVIEYAYIFVSTAYRIKKNELLLQNIYIHKK